MQFLSKPARQDDETRIKNTPGSSRGRDKSAQNEIPKYLEKKPKTPCGNRKKKSSVAKKSTPSTAFNNQDDKFHGRFSKSHYADAEGPESDTVDREPPPTGTQPRSNCASPKATTLSPSLSRSPPSLEQNSFDNSDAQVSKNITPGFSRKTLSRPTSSQFELRAQARLFENSTVGNPPACENSQIPTLEDLWAIAEKPIFQEGPEAHLLESNNPSPKGRGSYPGGGDSPCIEQVPMRSGLDEQNFDWDIQNRACQPQLSNAVPLMDADNHCDYHHPDACVQPDFNLASATMPEGPFLEPGFLANWQDDVADTSNLDELLTRELKEGNPYLSPDVFDINSDMVNPIDIPPGINDMGWIEDNAFGQTPYARRSAMHEQVRFGSNETGFLNRNMNKSNFAALRADEAQSMAFWRPNKLY